MGSRADLPRWVAAALAVQLVAAAGAVAGPWAVVPPVPAMPPMPAVAPADAEQPAAAVPAPAPVVVSAAGLWSGEVTAVPLGVDAAGRLEVPRTEAEIGWWADGPRPGEAGAAVLVGHVDLNGRPGVFARLAQAPVGAIVTVGAARFRVTRVDRYAKAAFPTDVVYRPAAGPELRLITCGGRFDPRSGHYEDNVVVQAVGV